MDGSSLWHYGIHYEITEYEDIASILITIPYPNDVRKFYIYNYDFAMDKECTNADILAMKGMTEEAFVEEACEKVRRETEYVLNRIPEEYREVYSDMLDLLEEANSLTTADAPMYLDKDGTLIAIIPYPTTVFDIRDGFYEFK